MNTNKYTSKCCDARATKPACERTDKHMATLGTWHCQKCGNTCSVSRHKEQDEANEV